jgi:hypothetical protein
LFIGIIDHLNKIKLRNGITYDSAAAPSNVGMYAFEICDEKDCNEIIRMNNETLDLKV